MEPLVVVVVVVVAVAVFFFSSLRAKRRGGKRENEAKLLEGSSGKRTSHSDESLAEAINCWAVTMFHSGVSLSIRE